jgi:hypothetical protein
LIETVSLIIENDKLKRRVNLVYELESGLHIRNESLFYKMNEASAKFIPTEAVILLIRTVKKEVRMKLNKT